MGIDLCCLQFFMSQQFLYEADVGTLVQQMGGEAVTESMDCDRFTDTGGFYSPPEE